MSITPPCEAIQAHLTLEQYLVTLPDQFANLVQEAFDNLETPEGLKKFQKIFKSDLIDMRDVLETIVSGTDRQKASLVLSLGGKNLATNVMGWYKEKTISSSNATPEIWEKIQGSQTIANSSNVPDDEYLY